MTKRNNYFLAILILIAAGLAFLAPSYGWRLRNVLSPLATGQSEATNLSAENEALKAQLAEFETIASQLGISTTSLRGSNPSSLIPAMVYSRYPMNFKNEMLVDAGAGQGVTPGKGVLFNGLLVGTIYRVFSDGAVAQTVFDPGFRLPVRIGTSSVDALLQGGTEPAVVSISKDAKVQEGDIIYAAAPGIPYAVPIGEVGEVSMAENSLFQQATVNFAYDINSIRAVQIEK